jgi:hypothetical protein
MSDYILVNFSSNWADEMNIKGHTVMSREQWDKFIVDLNKVHWKSREFYIGTNEALEWNDKAHYMRSIITKTLSPDQYAVLCDLNLLQVGFFVDPTEYDDDDEDWNDDDSEDD